MWYLYTMEYYSAMKKNEILSFAGKWMELDNIILSKFSQVQKSYVLPHMQTLDQGQTQQGDCTLIRWWVESTQGRYEDRQETQKKKKKTRTRKRLFQEKLI
jgi:hypothetical protein